MAGRKPKPTALKEVLGNPGHRPLNANEPRPGGAPDKPRFLKGRAAKIWEQYVPKLVALGVLSSVDGHMFSVWCCLAAEFEDDPERMTASRIAQMRNIGSCFGLDASARARMSVKDGDPASQDPADKYFAQPVAQGTARQVIAPATTGPGTKVQ